MGGDPNLRTCGDHVKAFVPGEWEWVHEVARTWRAETGKIGVVVYIAYARCTGDDSDQTNSRGSGSLFFTDKDPSFVRVFQTFRHWTFTNASASW